MVVINHKLLDSWWKCRDEIRAEWTKNGWKKGGLSGRDITFSCGHTWYVGYGISDDEAHCHDCLKK